MLHSFVKLLSFCARFIYGAKTHIFTHPSLPGEISYVTLGEGKEVLLFLPGFANSKENNLPALKKLSQKMRVIILDLPGFGESFYIESESFTLDAYSRWIEIFISETLNERFHLVGCSLGGAVALKIVGEKRVFPKTLTLVDSAGLYVEGERSAAHDFLEGNNPFGISDRASVDRFLNKVFEKRKFSIFLKEFIYHYGKTLSQRYRKIGSDLFSFSFEKIKEEALNKYASNIEIPLNIIWGEKDRFFPISHAHYLHSQNRDSKLYILSKLGHSPHLEDAHVFSGILMKIFN